VTVPDPIEVLLKEHEIIMGRIADLRRAVGDLESRSADAVGDALPALRSVGEMMATTLHLHAKKEDEALFPALEAVFGAGAGPTVVMREEHRAIHAQAELFRKTLHELHEVEHPEIVRQGAGLRDLAAKGGGAAELKEAGSEIIRLLDAHFGKEEMVLFPMARSLLRPEALRLVMDRMEEIEAEGRR